MFMGSWPKDRNRLTAKSGNDSFWTDFSRLWWQFVVRFFSDDWTSFESDIASWTYELGVRVVYASVAARQGLQQEILQVLCATQKHWVTFQARCTSISIRRAASSFLSFMRSSFFRCLYIFILRVIEYFLTPEATPEAVVAPMLVSTSMNLKINKSFLVCDIDGGSLISKGRGQIL